MVLLGGATRLTNSGLSMVHWSPLGSLPPMNDVEWEQEFKHYQSSPEFRIVNKNFTVEKFRDIYWFEFIHRMTGRFIGIVFIIPFLWFWIKKKFPQGFLKKMFLLLCLGALQGVVGWLMVKSGLQKDPHVSHYRLAIHLLMALTLFGFIFWFMLDLLPAKKDRLIIKTPWPVLFLLALVLQIFYGALTAGLKSGYLYPTFPLMGENVIPPLLFPGMGWKVIFEGHVAVQFIHRVLAFTLLITGILAWWRTRKLPDGSPVKQGAIFILFGLGIQVSLGAVTVLSGISILPALLHQVMAFVLTAAGIWLLHRNRG